MKKRVLAVGYDKEKFNDAQRETLKYDIFIHIATNISAVIAELAKQFPARRLFSDSLDFLYFLKILRSLTKTSILVMRHRYDGNEKSKAIEAGADEYIEWSDTIPKGRGELPRTHPGRYTELNRQDSNQLNIQCH